MARTLGYSATYLSWATCNWTTFNCAVPALHYTTA